MFSMTTTSMRKVATCFRLVISTGKSCWLGEEESLDEGDGPAARVPKKTGINAVVVVIVATVAEVENPPRTIHTSKSGTLKIGEVRPALMPSRIRGGKAGKKGAMIGAMIDVMTDEMIEATKIGAMIGAMMTGRGRLDVIIVMTAAIQTDVMIVVMMTGATTVMIATGAMIVATPIVAMIVIEMTTGGKKITVRRLVLLR